MNKNNGGTHMNINIVGCGQIAPGEYESIRIGGSGKLAGLVRCAGFSTTGSSRGVELDCKGAVKVSGSSSFTKNITAESLSVTGSLDTGSDLVVRENLDCSGALQCGGSIRCGTVKVSGGVETDGDVEAESVTVSGTLDCEGLLNAETIVIKGSGMRIGSIGGSTITIQRPKALGKLAKIPLLSTVIKTVSGMVEVPGGIEGDTIVLENVCTPRVSGRIVTVGEDCKIDLVQYSESISVSPNAKVARIEQV